MTSLWTSPVLQHLGIIHTGSRHASEDRDRLVATVLFKQPLGCVWDETWHRKEADREDRLEGEGGSANGGAGDIGRGDVEVIGDHETDQSDRAKQTDESSTSSTGAGLGFVPRPPSVLSSERG